MPDVDDIQTVKVVSPQTVVTVIGTAIPQGGPAFTLNASTGSVSLVAGTNITLQSNASTITIVGAAGGGGGNVVSAIGTVGALSTGSITLAAGNNISLGTSANTITVSEVITVYAVGSLPVSPVTGQVAAVSDGASGQAYGAVIVGGGSTSYIVWWNGSNWLVVGATQQSISQLLAPTGDVSWASNKVTSLLDPTNPQDAASKNYVDTSIAAITPGTGTGVITGCGVVWTGNLNFTVAAGTYSINGITYSVAQTNLTLAAADMTNDRFDVIAVDTSSTAVVVQGTPANPALIPTVDPATQLYLTAVSIPANATTPGNVTNILVYDEDTGGPGEYNATSSGSTWALASTNNPHSGTKDIEATSLTGGAFAQLQKPSSTLDLSTVNNLVFYIRSKAAWNANRSLTLQFLNAGTQVGNTVTFHEGSFGFVSSNTTSYQQIVVPLSLFNIGSTPVNQLKFIAAGSGGSAIGFYLDTISFQGGVTITTGNFMTWRGTWSSTTAYVKNDVVLSSNVVWVCLLPNTNSTPTTSNANWQAAATLACSVTALGNTTGSSSGSFSNLLSISGAGIVSVGVGAGSITISASTAASANVVSALGTAGALSTGSIVMVAGANITLNTGASSITIVGPTPGAGGATQSFSGGGTSITGTAVSVALFGGNNISLASASGAGSLSLTFNASSNALNNVSLLNASSGALSISAGAGIGIGQANSTITISASNQAEGTQSFSGGGTSVTGTGISVALVGGNNISLASASGAGSITLTFNASSNALNNVSLLNASSGAMSISAGAGIGIGQANSTVTVSASNQTSSLSYVAALGTAAATSTGTIILAAGANITLNTGANSITIVGPSPGGGGSVSLTALGNTTSSSSGTYTNLLNVSGAGGVSVGAGAQSMTISGPAQTTLVAGANISLTSGGSSITIIGLPTPMSFTQNVDLGLVAGTIVSKAGTITGTAGVGSSLFLERIRIPGNMSVSEIDAAMSIGFPATNQGAGTMSRSMVIYSFGNSTSLASVMSASSTSAWQTGTSTSGAVVSLTQFQGGWSAPMIQPMTFASSSLSPGDYVVGQLFNFAQGSSTWTLNLYGAQAASSFLASAATNLTSATLGARSSGGMAAASGLTALTQNATNNVSWFVSRASSAVSSVASATSSFTFIEAPFVGSLGTITGSIATATASLGAVTNVALGALNSSTVAQLGFPNFGFIGTNSTTSGFPFYFSNGIMSTGAVPVAITLTSAAVTFSGSVAFQQPWFALAGQ